MRKRRKVVISLILLCLFIGVFLFFNGNPMSKRQAKIDTITYLAEKGVYDEDILKITVGYDWLKMGDYRTRVIFKDEPSEIYYYAYDVDGDIYLWTSTNFGEHPRDKR